MTKVVRGAGRKKAAAQKKKHDQKDVVTGGKRDDSLKKAAKPAKKAASAKKDALDDSAPTTWDPQGSLGANVDRLKTAGVTWKGIAEAANANGHEVPWPDGGRLLRARKQFLAGTEGQPAKQRSRKATAKRKPGEPEPEAMTAEERIARALSNKSVPWQEGSDPHDHTKLDYTDEELMEMLVGRRITYISRNSGREYTSKIPKESKHTKIEHGKDGPYVSFASMEGPFEAISLSRIINVS